MEQPRLCPRHPPSLHALALAQLTAVTRLDLSHIMDWIQHPATSCLADLRAIEAMTQLRELSLRPASDTIDNSEAQRMKTSTGVLYWSGGVAPRLWDRWMYAFSPGIPTIHNKTALRGLTQLEAVQFPITMRASEQADIRAQMLLTLPRLRDLLLGRASIKDAELQQLATTLTSLSLGCCQGVTGAGLAAIAGMRDLRRLQLHACARMSVTDDWAALLALTALHTLALCGRSEGENVHFYALEDPTSGSVPMTASGASLPTLFPHRRHVHRRPVYETHRARAGLRNIASMTHLRDLRMGVCGGCTDTDLALLAPLDGLTALELFGCTAVASSAVSTLLHALPRLQRLTLRNIWSRDLSYAGSAMQLIGQLRDLRALSLHRVGNSLASRAELEGMAAAVMSLTQLESLLLWGSNAQYLDGRDWAPLRALTRLSRLAVSCRVTDEQVENVAALPHLHTVEFMSALRLTNRSLAAIAQVPGLRNLDLNECPNIDDAGMTHLAARTGLLTFQLIGSGITDKSLQLMGRWKRLRNLSLARTDGIGDEGLRALCAATHLKVLDVTKCTNITDKGLVLLVKLRDLRHLNIEQCSGVSNAGVARFKTLVLKAGPIMDCGLLDSSPAIDTSLASVVVFF